MKTSVAVLFAVLVGTAGQARAAAPRADEILARALFRFDAMESRSLTVRDGRVAEWRDANGGAYRALPFADNAAFDVPGRPKSVKVTIAGKERPAVDFGEFRTVKAAGGRFAVPAEAGGLELVGPDGKKGWTKRCREYVAVVMDKVAGRMPDESKPDCVHPALVSGDALTYRNLDELSNYSNHPVWTKFKGKAPAGTCAFAVDGGRVGYNYRMCEGAGPGFHIVQASYAAAGDEWTFRLRQLGGELCRFPGWAIFGGTVLCELAVFEQPLSDAERQAVARHLERKWLEGDGGLPVIPKVKDWKPSGAGVWTPSGRLALSVRGGREAETVARQLKDDWALAFPKASEGDAATQVALTLDPMCGAGDEGYRMTIAEKEISFTAATRRGLYWATRTLLQLARSGEEIPCGTAVDRPDYPLRGFMLDVGRKFFPMSFLREIAKDLAYYKLNTFHVHLNDDIVNGDMQYWAFRLESRIPGLTALDGSYTKDEFRRFVKACAEIGVNVIPEFDAPGHSLAFAAVRPDLRLKAGWDQLDTSRSDLLPFIRGVWEEYLEGDDPVFAGPDVHAGTDEYCRGSIEGYRAFADGLFRYLLGKGKRVHAWGSFSACTGKTEVVSSPDITVDLWHHKSYLPEKALQDGYSVTSVAGSFLYIVPGASYYHDYLDERAVIRGWSPSVGDGGHPIPASVPRLRGGKFAVWNDLVANGITTDDVFDRVFPALRVVAEKTWASAATDWRDYERRRDVTGEAPGVDLRDAEGRRAIGWSERGGWTVSFALKYAGKPETLFNDGTSQVKVFPCGRFGFSRDGYDVEFDFVPKAGVRYEIRMTGTPKATALYVDGKLVQTFDPEPVKYPNSRGGRGFLYYRTLHFPLVPAVGCCSRVTGLKATPLN